MEHVPENDDLCPICYCEKEAETRTFVCTHIFCQSCLVTWYKNCKAQGLQPVCPLCKKVDNIWSD